MCVADKKRIIAKAESSYKREGYFFYGTEKFQTQNINVLYIMIELYRIVKPMDSLLNQ